MTMTSAACSTSSSVRKRPCATKRLVATAYRLHDAEDARRLDLVVADTSGGSPCCPRDSAAARRRAPRGSCSRRAAASSSVRSLRRSSPSGRGPPGPKRGSYFWTITSVAPKLWKLRTMLLLKPVTIETIAMTVATPTTIPRTVSAGAQLVRRARRAARTACSRRSRGAGGSREAASARRASTRIAALRSGPGARPSPPDRGRRRCRPTSRRAGPRGSPRTASPPAAPRTPP